MALYQTGSNIGELLRLIREGQSQSPIIGPQNFPGSPIRGVVQQPLKSPESVGTSRVVAIRPEQVTSPGTEPTTALEGGTVPTGTLLNNQPGSLRPSSQSFSQPSVQSQPTQQRTTQPGNLIPTGTLLNKRVTGPALGTQIRPSTSVQQNKPRPSPAPQPSRVGQPFAFNIQDFLRQSLRIAPHITPFGFREKALKRLA